jgi:hypothetical protein
MSNLVEKSDKWETDSLEWGGLVREGVNGTDERTFFHPSEYL